MATAPVPVTRAPRKKAANGTKSTKKTLTLSFDDKYASLYDQLKSEAEEDDRPLHQYVLRLLNSSYANGKNAAE